MLSEQSGIQVDKFYPPTDWQYSFPEGYTRLEYLQGDGSAYIDTGFIPNQDTIYKCRVSNTFTGTQAFMGISGGGGLFGIEQQSSGNLLFAQYYTTGSTSRMVADIAGNDGIIRDFELRKNEFYINNTLIGSNTAKTFTGTVTTKLFTQNPSSSISKVKIYFAQIYNDTTIVRNFVPAKRNSDNKPGMYDLVNDVFYVNQGTGEFVMGSELYLNNSQIDIRQKNNTNFVEKYKFNENNELVWANPQLNLSGPVNYSVVGSPTIVDGVVSGFSSSNYLSLPHIPENSSFELNIVFDCSSYTEAIGLYRLGGSAFCGVLETTASNKLRISYRTLDSSTTKYHSFSYNLNEKIKYNMKFDNNSKTLQSIAIQNNIIIDNITLNNVDGNEFWYIFNIGYTRNSGWNGNVYMNETYVKVNDKLWFYGKNYTSENYAPVPAGLNYNNTTTPSIGYVNTQTQEFTPAPTDGIKYSQTRDIKVIPPEDNTITLLYGVTSDFSKYSLFGLLANVSSGTYDVYIDDVLYATTASRTQTDIDFSTLGNEYISIGTCTTPESLVLHKIVIKPTTIGETITAFRCIRTSGASGTQAQGCLWAHLELKNNIALTALFNAETTTYTNNNLYSVTAKNNTLRADLSNFSFKNTNVVYLPYIIHYSSSSYGIFTSVKCKRIKVNITGNISSIRNFLTEATQLEKLDTNISTQNKLMDTTNNYRSYKNTYKLKQLPCNKFNALSSVNEFVISNTSLYPTKLDVSDNKDLTILGTYGNSTYPMRGLRGLKVSNEAPFSGSSPQINVSYTGLDRDALVELFNSLPTVTGGQTINITAATGNNLTKVGTPTIDANGVVSGFSANDYLVMPKPVSGERDNIKQSFEIQTKITIANTLPEKGGLVFYPINGTDCGLTLISDGRIRFRLYGSPSYAITTKSNLISTNQTYWLKGIVKNNIAELLTSLDGINWTSQGTLDITDMPAPRDTTNTPKIGINGNASSTWVFTGSIDLENTYIKVDNNYLMKGYLTDNDRLIATNKGWTITG